MERRLVAMRYSQSTVKNYQLIFGWIGNYLAGYGESNYSKKMGQRFIAEYRLQENHAPSLFKSSRTVVRRIDEILEDKQFTPCFRAREIECPPRFAELQGKYLEHLAKLGYRDATITSRKLYTGRLLAWLPGSISSLETLSAPDLGVFQKPVNFIDISPKNDFYAHQTDHPKNG